MTKGRGCLIVEEVVEVGGDDGEGRGVIVERVLLVLLGGKDVFLVARSCCSNARNCCSKAWVRTRSASNANSVAINSFVSECSCWYMGADTVKINSLVLEPPCWYYEQWAGKIMYKILPVPGVLALWLGVILILIGKGAVQEPKDSRRVSSHCQTT